MAIGDFETQKKNLQEKIVAAEEEAQFSMNMSEVESLNKQMADLEAKKSTFEDVSIQAEQGATESQVSQITKLGGTEEVLEEKLEEKNKEVEKVEEVVEEKAVPIEKKVEGKVELQEGVDVKTEEVDAEESKEVQKQKLEEMRVEKLISKYKEIEEGVQKKWNDFIKSGELEKSKNFRLAKQSVDANSNQNFSIALSAISDFERFVCEKAWEIAEPLEKFRLDEIEKSLSLGSQDIINIYENGGSSEFGHNVYHKTDAGQSLKARYKEMQRR